MAVSKEMIVDASLKILNRDGIEGLSMRTIAKELGIKAASLYGHISGKQELFGEIVEYLCYRFVIPENTDNIKDFLMKFYMEYRRLLLTLRDSASVFENSIPNTPKRIEIMRINTDALIRMGIHEKNLLTASNLLNNYVLSFTADEVRFRNIQPEMISDFVANLSPVDKKMFNEIDFDEQFLYGLQVLFAGLEATEMQQ